MSRPLILMYHRVADAPIDPWQLAVSPAHFEEQLDVLRRIRRPLPLAEFVGKLAAGTLPSDAVALTFDDGYVDNFLAAAPRLAARDIPATIFLATGCVDSPEPFWWDELARLVLVEEGPTRFEVIVKGEAISCDLGAEPPAREDGSTPIAALLTRQTALESIHQSLRRVDEGDRRAALNGLRSTFAGFDGSAVAARPMTGDEVRTLAKDGLITIGAHSVNHPELSYLEASACALEIGASKRACEALIDAPVTAFAYPFGAFNDATCSAARTAGFTFACATRRAIADNACDMFSLPRIFVPDLDGDAFEQRLRWASANG